MPKDEQPKKKPTKEVIQQVCDWMFEDIVAAGTQYGRNIVNSVRAKFGPELLKPNGRSLHPRLLRAFINLGGGRYRDRVGQRCLGSQWAKKSG